MTKRKTNIDRVAAKLEAGVDTVTDAASRKVKQAGRALRDAALHSKDELEDLEDKLV